MKILTLRRVPALRSTFLKSFFWLLCLTLFCAAFWALGLPLACDVIGLSLAFLSLLRLGWLHSSLVFVSFFLGVSASLISLPYFVELKHGAEEEFRPHERLTTGRSYRAHVDLTAEIPHGDLISIDPQLRSLISEPRKVVFQTDSRGFRNSQEYKNQSLLLVGDSFVVGNGSSQNSILSSQLDSRGISAYNIAYPSHPYELLDLLRDFEADLQDSKPYKIFFFFEGNDFGTGDTVKALEPSAYERLKMRVFSLSPDLFTASMHLFNLSHRLWFRATGHKVEVMRLAGIPVGFFANYIQTSTSKNLTSLLAEQDAELLRSFDLIVFIPTKYRVYKDLLLADELTEPSRALEIIGELLEGKVPLLDLTAPLRNKAHQIISDREFVFWRDDTHWNQIGISVAADEIARVLTEQGKL